MNLFYATNLTKQSVTEGAPWAFKIGEVPENVRAIKADRQAWYENPGTRHCFYSAFEGVNPNIRIGKDNPPRNMRAIVFDVDHGYTDPVLRKKIDKLPFRPTWVEKSLGTGWHLVWELDEIAPFTDDNHISELVLVKLAKLLKINDWAGFDEGAWVTTSRLYANGGSWWREGDSRCFKADTIKSLIMETVCEEGRKMRACPVPMERIIEMIKVKYPNFDWPGEFVQGSQGPSFWIEGSTSPKSAVVHADGIYTFSAHRTKDKYYWDDILGPGVLERDREERICRAAKEYFFDGLAYFGPRPGAPGYKLMKIEHIRRALSQQFGLSLVPPKKKNGISEVERAIFLIERDGGVDGAAPFIFRPPGIIVYNTGRYLNLLDKRPMRPAEGHFYWGPDGGFPFISDWLGRTFISQEQLDHYLSWLHWYYGNAVKGSARAGQAVFLGGGPGVGKTLLCRKVIGAMVGGHVDATRYLMDKDGFGGHLFEYPLWGVDDSSMTNSNFTIRQFTANVKRMIANQNHEYHQKYQRPVQIDWFGRLHASCNLDAYALAVVPALEDSIFDKVNFYRLISNTGDDRLPDGYFPDNVEEVIAGELPPFCKFICDWSIPEEFRGDSRYGIAPFHDGLMARAAFVNSGTAQFFEMLVVFMKEYKNCFNKTIFRGTAMELYSQLISIESIKMLIRGMSLTTLSRHLANLQVLKSKFLQFEATNDGSQIWTINMNERE